MNLEPGDSLLFIGDSVTDCGRLRPVGGGSLSALGDGYVAAFAAHLAQAHPDLPVPITNMGTSGNTVRDLAGRWEEDAIGLGPDFLSIFIGINDVWRQFDKADRGGAVPPDEFERTYDGLVRGILPQLKGLVLVTPFYVQPDRGDPMRRTMDAYGSIVSGLAARHGAVLLDAQEVFDRLLPETPFEALAPDRVHPTPLGHRALAKAFVGAFGL